VIARRHHVDAPLEQLIADLARDAEAGGRVLGVRDHEIDLVMSTSAAALRISSRPAADDVADEERRISYGCRLSRGADR
jgi:hypothetical protein